MFDPGVVLYEEIRSLSVLGVKGWMDFVVVTKELSVTDKFVYSYQLSARQYMDDTFLSMICRGLWEKRDNFGVNSGKILP